MALKKIRPELARNHDFPEGSSTDGYEFVAPVNAEGLFHQWKSLSRRMPSDALLGR